MVEQIFWMGDQRLGDILTPRTQVVWLDIEKPFRENLTQMYESQHSKFPVGRGSLDEFLGIIDTKDVFRKLVNKEEFDLKDRIRDTLVLPESMMFFRPWRP